MFGLARSGQAAALLQARRQDLTGNITVLILVSFLALGRANLSVAQCAGSWPSGTDQGVGISPSTGGFTPSVAPDLKGGFYTAYSEGVTSGPIRVARVDSAGVRVWDVPVASGTMGSGQFPVVAVDGAGGCFVAWIRGLGTSIRAAHLTEAGSVTWTGAVLTASFLSNLRISSDGTDGAWVAASERLSPVSSTYANRMNTAGALAFGSSGLLVGQFSAPSGTAPRIAIEAFQDATLGSVVVGAFEATGDGGAVRAFEAASTGLLWSTEISSSGMLNSSPAIVYDGAGGVIVSWVAISTTGGGASIQTEHLNANGVMVWGLGVGISWPDFMTPYPPQMVSDGEGGAIVGWIDGYSSIHAARLDDAPTYSLAIQPLVWHTWTIASNALLPRDLSIASDGESGAVFTWTDHRGAGVDIYAQRVSADGTVLWAGTGVPVATGPGAQGASDIALIASAADFANPATGEPKLGFAVAWEDVGPSTGNNTRVLARRIDYFGAVGCPAPVVTSLGDVVGDQGGFVELKWSRSYLDDLPADDILFYSVWRRLPADMKALPGPVIDLGLAGREDLRALVNGAARFVATKDATGTPPGYWELVGTLDAHHNSQGYTFTAPTRMDSSDVAPGAAADHLFFVSAHGRSGHMRDSSRAADSFEQRPWWDSNVVTGRSVDNLGPVAPASFQVNEDVILTKADGLPKMVLTWAPNAESDLRDYAVYKGATPDFTPANPIAFIARVDATIFEDTIVTSGQSVYYRVAAFDAHGNASPYTAAAGGIVRTEVGSAGTAAYSLSPSLPNPMIATTEIQWSLPTDGAASLRVYDLSGREVRALIAGAQVRGSHRTVWDGMDNFGKRVASGTYFYRLEAGAFAETRKLAVVR